jgi:hypothetical protein
MRYLVGRTCGLVVCFPIEEVSEVGRLPRHFRSGLNGAGPAVLHLHGRTSPIADLSGLLGLAPRAGAPQWFVAGRGDPPVCVTLESVDGWREAREHCVALAGQPALDVIELDGRSVPVIPLGALARGERP